MKNITTHQQSYLKYSFIFFLILLVRTLIYAEEINNSPRERLLMDYNWRFALGHATDALKDYGHRTAYFSYFAKTGYGDGPAAAEFDDRAWRVIDLPHDWCVELPFDPKGGHSHGYKAIGRNFPENSVGWYRKKFHIPETDLGKRIIIQFEGVHRDAVVWVNGFYCGTNHSGYYSFEYDITDYINYGGENTVAVRVDATMEEGWYYEGAGIYRHVWLIKTNPLHVASNGTFITTELNNENNHARIVTRTHIVNESNRALSFDIEERIINVEGKTVAQCTKRQQTLMSGAENEWRSTLMIQNPELWSIENPYLHKLITIVYSEGKIIDYYQTVFGIRTVRFDANYGFFLNGKSVKIKGTNLHQDHAGVGVAVPDALQDYRILRLKAMGSNAIRTAHNPPAPALLDACDRLGMLVLDENRLMGINQEHLSYLENLIKRDRNHPSVILWSLGNEEWAIEGNIKGARIGSTMQNYANKLDSSRAFTTALSGGWDSGTGTVMQVMGYNYIVQGDIDQHHKKFPWQAGIGTEESNTIGTRGIYETNEATCHMAPTNRMPENVGTEYGWKFYSDRPFLAGLFYWTGFDYHGESNPYGWPAVSSQYGIVDLCGFPKDIFYYLKAWWSDEPVLHIYPHWNWKGREGDTINVVAYSNCDEVELSLNGKKISRNHMPVSGHLEWKVAYQPGTLIARGYQKGKEVLTQKTETTGAPASLLLSADKTILNANRQDVAVLTVAVTDTKGRLVPDAQNEVIFTISGPGKIIGIGNGDPSSHEKERFVESIIVSEIKNLKELPVNSLKDCPQVSPDVDNSSWIPAFSIKHKDWRTYKDTLLVVRGTFELPQLGEKTTVHLFARSIVENQSIYINGVQIAAGIQRDEPGQSYQIDRAVLKPGLNTYAVTGQRFRKKHQWDEPNTDPGVFQVYNPAPEWKRRLFNGLAQVIIQTTEETGEIIINAESAGLKQTQIKILSQAPNRR
jgi:beta-galactosidase